MRKSSRQRVREWMLFGCPLLCAASSASVGIDTFAGTSDVESMLGAADDCATGESMDSCSLNLMQMRRSRKSFLSTTVATEVAAEHKFGWVAKHRAPGQQMHELGFVVRTKDFSKLEESALARTNPLSKQFRQWMSSADVTALTRNDEAIHELRSALHGHGVAIVNESKGGDLIRAQAPVSSWESFLSTEFHTYVHPEVADTIIRSEGYLLPEALQPHVVGVLRALDFEHLRPKSVPGVDDAEMRAFAGHKFGWGSVAELEKAKGHKVVTPSKLRKVYNMPPIAPRGSSDALKRSKTSQAVYATLGQHWSPDDRTKFEATFDIPEDRYVKQLKGQDMGFAMSADALCKQKPRECSEANLDVQYMMAMSPWSKMGFWYVPHANAEGMYGFLTDFLNQFVDSENTPHVISISYGMPEFSVSKTSLLLFEVLSMKLALQGVTIFVASGDDGAASFLSRKKMQGKECWSVPLIGLQVSWPASSQWVTSVGATSGPENENDLPEVVCQSNMTGNITPPLITSGGGYSQAFKRPSWQNDIHDNKARGVPDLAIMGHAYAMVIGGRWLSVDGTSASAPTLAGMISLINAELIADGRPTVGFLNQVLYAKTTQQAGVYNDIVKGDNKCASFGAPCCGGYEATKGWDPVTGLGSIDHAKLKKQILAYGM